MKHEIIKTDNYLLVVDGSEIKEGDYVLSKLLEVNIFGKYYELSLYKKIIAHLPLNNSPILQGVDLLPPLEQEDDVEKLIKIEQTINFLKGKGTISWYEQEKRKEYYNKAKEKYKYTDEDIKNAFKQFFNNNMLSVEEIIKSLSQPKIPVGFECEMENKIAMDGHTIIGSEPKTTTTPEGHTQWIGTYIYE